MHSVEKATAYPIFTMPTDRREATRILVTVKITYVKQMI